MRNVVDDLRELKSRKAFVDELVPEKIREEMSTAVCPLRGCCSA